MKIGRIFGFNERVFDAVLRLLPQLVPDADLSTSAYFRSILTSGNIHFFIGEMENNK